MDEKKEEERLMRRVRPATNDKSAGPKRILIEAPKVNIPTPGGTQGKVRVELVTKTNHANVLRSLEVTLNKGRIPIRHLMDQWHVRHPVWVDADLPVGQMPDGFSDLEFIGMDKVRLVDDANN